MRFSQKYVLIVICAALAIATLVAYEPIRHNDFATYTDDDVYVTENTNVTGGITSQSVIRAFTKPYAANWHPITWLSHMLDCQFFGLNPFWHHLISLLLHITNSLLLFWILTSITGAIWPSAFVAAVFALHPLQVESVAWAAERKTVLSGFFWFLTIAIYIWYTKRSGIGRYILLFMVYALCIMTKPVVVTVPLVLLLLDYWPLERFNWEYHPAGKSVPLGRLLIEKAPLFALTAALCVITLISQRQEGAVAPLEICHLDYRVGNMFLSYIRYIGKTIWPSRLAVLYPYPHINFLNTIVVVCALLFVLITVFCIYIGRRRKYIAVGWLLYVGTLVPMIGLVQVGSQAMADRYMYISMLGLLIIAAWSVKELVANRPRWRVVAAVLAVVALSSAIILTRIQARYWENGLTLFEHTLKVTENNAITENNYGCALLKADRLDKAVLHLSNALRISPTYPDARYNLGETFLRQGKLDEAIACFNELLRRKQGSADTYYNLAAALGMQKKYDDAIKYLTKVLELDPKYPNAYNNMGIALLATGKNAEAIKYLNEALLTNSNNAGLYENLGNAYIQTGNYELAIRNWTKALNLKPSSAEILNNLAWVLATTNDVSVRDANKAIEFATRSCELTENKKPEFMDTLAIAYAAAGRFEEAKATAGKALNIAKANKQEALAGEIQERIKLYEAGQPYREK